MSKKIKVEPFEEIRLRWTGGYWNIARFNPEGEGGSLLTIDPRVQYKTLEAALEAVRTHFEV